MMWLHHKFSAKCIVSSKLQAVKYTKCKNVKDTEIVSLNKFTVSKE